jgi:hypothetical protein
MATLLQNKIREEEGTQPKQPLQNSYRNKTAIQLYWHPTNHTSLKETIWLKKRERLFG